MYIMTFYLFTVISYPSNTYKSGGNDNSVNSWAVAQINYLGDQQLWLYEWESYGWALGTHGGVGGKEFLSTLWQPVLGEKQCHEKSTIMEKLLTWIPTQRFQRNINIPFLDFILQRKLDHWSSLYPTVKPSYS